MAEDEAPQETTAETVGTLTKTNLLIGEGQDEVMFFTALLREMGLSDVQVEHYGGKNGLGGYLETLKTRPGFRALKCLGVTRDADTNPSGSLAMIREMLLRYGFVVPRVTGEILTGQPTVGILVLPGQEREGMLETLCLDAIQEGVAWQCVKQFFACLEQNNSLPSNIAKAQFRTWLTVQSKDDVRGLGGAAKRGFFDWNDRAFDEIKSFLTGLFAPQNQTEGREHESK